MDYEIINRVTSSGLISLDISEWIKKSDIKTIDIKSILYQEMILRESDLRVFISNHNWYEYKSKFVGIYCSVDVIIPTWAYMLITSKLVGIANKIVFGNETEVEKILIFDAISKLDTSKFENSKVVIKGCSTIINQEAMLIAITEKLQPFVSSLFFGEPCSTVPIYRKQKEIVKNSQ